MRRAGEQRPGQRQHLLLASREPSRQLSTPLAEDGEAGVALLLEVGDLGRPAAVAVHEQVLGDGQVGEDGPAFGDGAQTPAGETVGHGRGGSPRRRTTTSPWWPASGRSPP